MGAGFEPSKGSSSFSSTAPSSLGVSMLVPGYGPTKPIQFAELETSRSFPFMRLTPVCAALAHYGLTRAFTCIPSHTFLFPRAVPAALQSMALLWASSFPHVLDVCVPVCHFTCTEHHCLTWPLCSHYPLVYVLFIYPRHGKWSEPSKNIAQESRCRNNLASFHNSSLWGLNLWADLPPALVI